MGYVVEDIDHSTKRLAFCFAGEDLKAFDFESQRRRSLKEKQRSVTLKGFRPGKAPLGMIEKVYRDDIETGLFRNFMFDKIQDAVKKESWEVLKVLPVEDLEYKQGDSLSFNVALEIVPIVEAKDISGYIFTRGNSQVGDQECYKMLERAWLLPDAETREVTEEGSVLEDDSIGIVDYKGIGEDGTVEMSDTEYWVNSDCQGTMLGLWKNILGMKRNEKKSFELVVSDDYSDEKIREKKLLFDVELLEIKKQFLPEFNDDFAKKHGFDSAEKMEKMHRMNVQEIKRDEVERRLRRDIEDRLLEDNSFEVSERLVGEQAESIREGIRAKFGKAEIDRKTIKSYLQSNEKDIRQQALRLARLSLIFRSLIKRYGIEISEEETYSSVENKVFDKILENVTVHEEKVS